MRFSKFIAFLLVCGAVIVPCAGQTASSQSPQQPAAAQTLAPEVASAEAAIVKSEGSSGGVRVQGPGGQPQLGFACCEGDIAQAGMLLSDPAVMDTLKDVHAEVALPILDFSPGRAELVRSLNREGIAAVAWLTLSPQDGLYMNADNEPIAEERVRAFEAWTEQQGLRWAAVGLDVEPNFEQLAALNAHKWRLFTTLLQRAMEGGRIERGRLAYSKLIRGLQWRGFVVQIYQMPYIPAERAVHSTVLDRLLGTVDVDGNQDYLMLYTSFAPQVGAGMIWSLGSNAQGIAVGSTDTSGGQGALDWNAFSRDLIVASHLSRELGVYNLEGCVRQGWLPRLKNFDWGQTVTIPADSVARAERMGMTFRVTLWGLSHVVWFAAGAVVLMAWLVRRRMIHKKLQTA